MADIFIQSCADIEAAYHRLGHTLGWRFLASPRATLSRDCEIALITMNPGGTTERPHHGRESSEAGCAYIIEAWKYGRYAPGEAPLQVQVRSLFNRLASAQGRGITGDALLNASLVGFFVPFRSPRFKALAQPRESLSFATELWARIFEYTDPKLVITIDQKTTRRLLSILSAKYGAPSRQQFPIGWGAYTADLFSFPSVDLQRALLRLPHLSRFPIFERQASRPHIERIIAAVASSLRW